MLYAGRLSVVCDSSGVRYMRGGFGCSPCCGPADCFAAVTPYEDSSEFNNADFLAGGILVGAQTISISAVTIYNAGLDQPFVDFGGGFTNEPTCRIFSNDTSDTSLPYGPIPNVSTGVLATLTRPASFASNSWAFTHSGISLDANTIYWVVLSVIGNSGYWRHRDYTGLISASATCFQLSTFSGNAGQSWAGNVPELQFLFDYS